MGKNKEDYNFKEQQNRFKDFDITEEHSSEEAYEYCKFLYHKELKNNIPLKELNKNMDTCMRLMHWLLLT